MAPLGHVEQELVAAAIDQRAQFQVLGQVGPGQRGSDWAQGSSCKCFLVHQETLS